MFDELFKTATKTDIKTPTTPKASTGMFDDIFSAQPKQSIPEPTSTPQLTQDQPITPDTPSIPKKNTFLSTVKSMFGISGLMSGNEYGGSLFLSKQAQEEGSKLIQPALDATFNTKIGRKIAESTKAMRGSSLLYATPKAFYDSSVDILSSAISGTPQNKDIVEYFNDSVRKWEEQGQDPNTNLAKQVVRGIFDSGTQSAVGALIGMIPVVGKPLSTTYFASMSASEQLDNEGRVTKVAPIVIDTVLDRVFGDSIETLFKTSKKELVKVGFVDYLKAFNKQGIVEGVTEPLQSITKFADSYGRAKTQEEKQIILSDAKEYVKNGGLLLEFLVGYGSGGLIGTGALGLSMSQIDPNIPKPKLGLGKEKDPEFSPEQNKIRQAFREDIAEDLAYSGNNKPLVARKISEETGINNDVTTLMVDEVAESMAINQPMLDEIDSEAIIQEALQEAGMVQEETKTPEVPTEQAKMKISKEEPLITEARKYKSAEEFVKQTYKGENPNTPYIDSNIKKLNNSGFNVKSGNDVITLYHGSNKTGLAGIKKTGFNEGSYFASDKKAAEGFVGQTGDVIPVKVRVSDLGFVKEENMAGTNGVIVQNFTRLIPDDKGIYTAKIDQFKTKSQLTDIWNKAQGEAKMKVKGETKKVTDQIDEYIKDKIDTVVDLAYKYKNKKGNPNLSAIEMAEDLQKIAKKSGPLSFEDRLTFNEIVKMIELDNFLPTNAIDTLQIKDDNIEYEQGTRYSEGDNGAIQYNEGGTKRGDIARERIYSLEAKQGGEFTISRRQIKGEFIPESRTLPQGKEPGEIKKVITDFLPKAKPETINEIVKFYNLSNKFGKKLTIQRTNTLDGREDFAAGMNPYDTEFVLSLKESDMENIKPSDIRHEMGHAYWFSIGSEGRQQQWSYLKQDYNNRKELYDTFEYKKEYWVEFVKNIKYWVGDANKQLSSTQVTDILKEIDLIDQNNKVIIPEDIIDSAFNFEETNNKLNTYLTENKLNVSSMTEAQNNLMADEINAFFHENVGEFKKSEIPEVKQYGESIENNTLEFKKEGTDEQFNQALLKLKENTNLTAKDIIKKHPDIELKRDITITDVYGNKAVLKQGEGITPYEVTGNKFILQDGEAFLVSKSQAENVMNNSIKAEAKEFAPELEQTEETIKGGDDPFAGLTREDLEQELRDYDEDPTGMSINEMKQKLIEINEDDMGNAFNKEDGDTKYATYTLPGGENYKEILIQAPLKDEIIVGGFDDEGNIIDVPVKKGREYETAGFKSSHWDEQNVISHIRMNERTYNGKKVAFMEELQSDWAREYRKNTEEIKDFKIISEENIGHGIKRYKFELPNGRTNTIEALSKEDAINSLKGQGNVPNNPLLKNWQELSIKRALQEAVNSNAKYFAWINGDQTSARYNLATQVDNIIWDTKPITYGGGTYTDIELVPKSSANKIKIRFDREDGVIGYSSQGDWANKKLDEVLGKGLADKIMSDEAGTLSGDGLKFGGEWADRLYNQQVPNIVKNLTGAKIETLDMGLNKNTFKGDYFNFNKKGEVDTNSPLLEKDIEEGKEVWFSGSRLVITENEGNGKFKAITKSEYDNIMSGNYDDNAYSDIDEALSGESETHNMSAGSSAGQQAIELTPEVKAIINGEARQIAKPSGKLPFEEQMTAPVMFKLKQPSNLTEKQQRIVKTQEFKNWFGDWENDPANASKIVDENGEPLVVYHGSNSESFDEFNPKYIGNRDSGWFGKGFYFALSKGEAGTYGKNITEAYLNIKKVFDFSKFYKGIESYKGYGYTDTYTLSKISDEITALNNEIEGRIYNKGDESTDFKRIGKKITLGEYKKNVEKENIESEPVYFERRNGEKLISYKYDDVYGKEQWWDTHQKTPFPKELLKYILYDKKYQTDFDIGGLYGVERKLAEYPNFTEDLKKLGYDGTMQSPDGDEYVVFEPNQIKSSSENTTFGPSGNIKFKIKLPKVDTGNKAEDAKQILAHVEKKLGVTSVVNSIKDKELAIEISKEALEMSPMQPFEKYVATGGTYKGQLPEVGGTMDELKKSPDFKRNTNPNALIFANSGDSLATELTGNENLTSDDVREQFEEYQTQKEKLAKEEKDLKKQKEVFKTTDTFKLVGQDKTLIGEITQSREMPETIMEIMDQVKKEKEARRKEVLGHKARPLAKYVDRKTQRLPKLGSNTAFGKEGEQILKDLKFDNVAEANQALSDYISKRNEFVNPVSRLALQERAAKFLRDKQKILDEVEKKIKAEARDRKSKIEAIRDFFYMTDGEVRDAIGDKDYRLLSDAKFEDLLNDLREKSIEIAQHTVAVSEVEWTIAEKELHRVENMQEVLGYPKDLNKMTTEQLNNLNDVLGKYERGDVFLGVREMETLAKNANLPDVKTQRQILEEVLGKRTGLPIEKLREIVVGSFDDLRSAVSLARQNAFYEVLVSDFYQLKIEAGLRYREIEQKTNELVRKARESRKQNWKQKLAPTDDMVIAYLEEGDLPTKALIAKDMSPQELELAHYVQQQYADMRDFLIARQQLDKARQNYYTHRPRGFFESWLRDGVVKSPSQFIKAFGRAFKETFIDVNKMDEATFKILNEQTEEILPLEKFFKYSMRRSGQLIPTKNLANAFLAYTKTFELKKGLDQYMPRMEAVARALTPTETTEGGVVMDTSLEKFVKKWINTQKGRPVTVGPIQPGGVLDGLLRSGVAFTRFLDLALRLPAQMMSVVGEESATWINIGTKQYALGQYRAKTKQGEKIAKKYESFVGTKFWDKMKEESSGIGSKLGETVFAFYGIAARNSNIHHLLGVLTKQEFESGNISPERLVEIKMEMNRWRADDLLKSVMGATSVGSVFREHKSWAIPIVNQTLSNIKTLSKMVQDGEYKQASKSKEFGELFRATMLTLIVVLTLSRAYKDLKEKKDRTLAEELQYRALNDAQSFLAALSPETLGSVPRLAGWFTDLTKALTSFVGAMATGDRTATGQIPGAKGLGAAVTPKLVKPLLKDTEEDKIDTSIKTSTIKAQKELDVINPEITDPAKKAWNEVKKVGVGTEEANAIVNELSDDQYEAYKLVKKADESYWNNLSEKVTPIVKQAFKLEFGSEEANKLVEPLSNDEYEMYKTVKSKLYGKGDDTAKPSDWDQQSFLTKVVNLAKGWTTDPVDAFNKIIKGGDWKITDVRNGQIIVDRMPMDASEKIKREVAKNNANYRLDHLWPVASGGGSDKENLNIISKEEWEINTPVEVYLIKQLKEGNITGKQAQEYAVRFKIGRGQVTSGPLFEKYKTPLTFEEIKQKIAQ